jgi:hypothetical protein
MFNELTLPQLRGSELCLTIVGAPPQGPQYEAMRFVAAYYTRVAMWLSTL